jgi:two-component system OmpR family sensor kinase
LQYKALHIILSLITAVVAVVIAVAFAALFYMGIPANAWLLVIIPLGLVAMVVSYLITGLFLGPLTQTITKVKALAKGDWQVRFMDERLAHAPYGVKELASTLDTVGSKVRATMAEVAAEGKRQGQFISDVSHELRTPLTAIHGAAETMLDKDMPYEDRERFCTTIMRESERLTRLANDLMTLQRIEGDGEIKLKRVNLHDVVERAAAALEPLLDEREAILTEGGEAPDVLGDPDRLQQVVQNLIDNASRFVKAGGRIHVELSGIKGHSIITVSDDGPGFGDIDPARLFDRFYRGDFSRARTMGGTGLGLTIVKAIVSAHEGTVEAINLPGGGACFIVAIPSLPA